MNDPISCSEQDSVDKIAKIREYESQGYLFHGSSNPNIDVLEPRQSNDGTGEMFNSDLAVYASPNPQVCIMALSDLTDAPKDIVNGHMILGRTKGSEKLIAKIPKKWELYFKKNTGYLYVLDKDSFDQVLGWQAKSNNSVVPIDKIPVTFDDFITLGGEVVWVEEE